MSRLALIIAIIVLLGGGLALIVFWQTGLAPSADQVIDEEAIAENNRAVGLMGQFEYDAAREIFSRLASQYPTRTTFKLNEAIATLNRQREGDEEAAMAMLSQVLVKEPNNLTAHYCLGLLRVFREAADHALPHFRHVADGDPDDAYAAYFVGRCLSQDQQYEQALLWYDKAIQLDPYLRSAYLGKQQALLRIGRREESEKMLEQFQRLESNPQARVFEFIYTRMGPKAGAIVLNAPVSQPVSTPTGALFLEGRPLVDNTDAAWVTLGITDRSSITACDINGDGAIDLFAASVNAAAGDIANAILFNNGDDQFALAPQHPLATVTEVRCALWGDYDNDGLTDCYLCRNGPNQLWRQVTPEVWQDVTDATNTGNGAFDTVDGAMIDADHDGDLDLFCVNADGPNELLNNNRDGTFRPLASDRGLTGNSSESRQVLACDLDNDRDVDIVVVNAQPPHDIYLNDRLWEYRRGPNEQFGALANAEISSLVQLDGDADGSLELLSAHGNTLTLWSPQADGQWAPTASTSLQDGAEIMWLAIADITGDGNIDSLCGTSADWRALSMDFSELHREAQPALSATPVVSDSEGGPALVTLAPGRTPLWYAPGEGRFPFATVSFLGREDKGKSMRSNASGIGTRFFARIDSFWTAGSAFRQTSGPGQSLQPAAVGTRGAPQIDFIHVNWSDGVFQSEIALASRAHHVIVEEQRVTSSCPVLFVWDGEKFEFVSDVLGVGGIGFLVEPGVYAPPRPWENFLLPAGLLKERNSRFALKLTEPMEEACYLDAARLVAYDLPPAWQMTLDERMGINAPQPTGNPRFYRHIAAPIQAVDQAGNDVINDIAATDRVAAPVGALDSRFLGRLEQPLQITLNFDQPLDAIAGEPMLIANGWIEYPYSQTMFAAWQAKAAYLAPTIEAMTQDGEWMPILLEFGYPAGMPREMSAPLPNLPPGCRTLRITTNQEIYWDRLAVAFAEPCSEAVRRVLPLEDATLDRCGFPIRPELPQRLPYYDYADRPPLWDTRHQAGFYTRFGPVIDLMREADDVIAIFGPGEEVHMEFAADLPALPPGWTRRFVLEIEGWCKDMDLLTRDGETIDPLPLRGNDSQHRRVLHERYSTRYVSGR